MEDVREKILALVDSGMINDMSFGEIADKIGVKYRSQPRHHIEKMITEGLLIRTPDARVMRSPGTISPSLVLIPVLGKANCGEATIYANGSVEGVIRLSPSTFRGRLRKGTFGVRAVGDSMNAASINGKTLDDGDMAIVEPVGVSEVGTGDYVLSVIDGMGNIKQLVIDDNNARVVLKSKSRNYYDDIVISHDDMYLYNISGRVVDVIKGVVI